MDMEHYDQRTILMPMTTIMDIYSVIIYTDQMKQYHQKGNYFTYSIDLLLTLTRLVSPVKQEWLNLLSFCLCSFLSVGLRLIFPLTYVLFS